MRYIDIRIMRLYQIPRHHAASPSLLHCAKSLGPMHVKLFLTTTSLHNVVISNSSDVIYYEIVTPKWERHHTRISRLDPTTRAFSLIGELQNGGDKATPIAYRLYGSTFRPTSEFLKPEERSKVEPQSQRKGKGKEKEVFCPAPCVLAAGSA